MSEAELSKYKCQTCYRVVIGDEYHPFLYCKLHLAGLLDETLALIQAQKAEWQRETAEHIKHICPVTEGWTVERLHGRIDTYIAELSKEQS